MSIDNMRAASEAVARKKSDSIEIEGQVTVIHRFQSLDFEAIWEEVSGLGAALLLAARGGNDIDWLALLIREVAKSPKLARLVAASATCPRRADNDAFSTHHQEVGFWDWADTFECARKALELNFGNKGLGPVMSFFAATGEIARSNGVDEAVLGGIQAKLQDSAGVSETPPPQEKPQRTTRRRAVSPDGEEPAQ